ncbi:hypothetical protein OsI_28682 [Oryza sativa Indica Group]|uniref:Uncharacterized protein n=1 Tax=Oryza sativa subsp. indica TaxID=39946 RepID=B8B9J7_ORYSI|nr:hypothetical protein OsI_28682 [Oryza sativa Indica Group]
MKKSSIKEEERCRGGEAHMISRRDEAAVDTLASNWKKRLFLLWASTVGLGGEVQLLTAARRRIGSVLSEAEGKEIQNKALELCLREASHHAARSDDLLGELEYYRIRGEVEVDELDELQDDDDMVSAYMQHPDLQTAGDVHEYS